MDYAEVGTFSPFARLHPKSVSGNTDQFTDVAVDSQYEHPLGSDLITAHATYIHESQRLDATHGAGGSAHSSEDLHTFRLDGIYHYGNLATLALGYFRIQGRTRTKSSASRTVGFLICAWLCVASVVSARADDVTNADLSRQIERLRQMIERLDRRVERLEGFRQDQPLRDGGSSQAAVGHAEPSATSTIATTPTPPPASRPTSTPPAADVSLRDLWRGVHRGMTRDDVVALLGPPSRKLQANSKPLWYYQYKVGSGSIAFDRDGYVEDWQRPPLGFWGLW